MLIKVLKSALTRVWKLKRLWIIYYLFGLLFAAVLVFPARMVVVKFAGQSLMGEKIGGRMDMDFLLELLRYQRDSLGPLLTIALLLALLFWLLLLFLSGGALKLMAGGYRYRARVFWESCGRYFGRFVRFALWIVPILAALLLLPLLLNVVKRLIWGKDPYESVTFWFTWLCAAGRYLGLMIWTILFDYGRFYIIFTNEKKMHRVIMPALRFVWLHFHHVFALALFLAAAGLVALAVYNPIADLLNAPNIVILILLFLWQQLYMVFRSGVRLAALASQLTLYKKLR